MVDSKYVRDIQSMLRLLHRPFKECFSILLLKDTGPYFVCKLQLSV
jgi:hypothetical protein